MVTTSSNTYWAPLKPRIRIYALEDDTYASPLYSYNGFTDTGSSNNKPIGLSFETSTTNVGQCSLTIEDADQDFNENEYLKGNRIFIEGSKDNVTWQPAFKGLHRGVVQEAYGPTGRNITFNAYNYLIRLGERIVQLNKESSKTGTVYNETDSTMFTDNLINDILTQDDNYVFSTSEAGGTGKPLSATNITSSPITQWIPKLDVEFGTLASAIDEILDYSGGLLTVNFANDQLVLYDPEQVTADTGVFMVTNTVNKLADEVNVTMYPLEPYSYSVHYDTDESANRLILPFKSPDSTPKTEHSGEFTPEQVTAAAQPVPGSGAAGSRMLYDFGKLWQARSITISPSGDPNLFRFVMCCQGNCSSFPSNSLRLWIHNDNPATITPSIAISGPMILYPQRSDGVFASNATFPSASTSFFVVGMRDADQMTIGELLINKDYWMVIESTAAQSNTVRLGLVCELNGTATQAYSLNGTSWTTANTPPTRFWNIDPTEAGQPENNLDWIVMANDRNGESKLGKVERTVTSIPNHIDGLQTIQEYLFPRLYLASKPRFSFDYPRLTMPNKIPKAGDVLCHYDTTVNAGTRTTPVQTSIITSARFEFGQDSDGVLGLRKLGLSTAGLRKGYY
jgi:hypothetical protein